MRTYRTFGMKCFLSVLMILLLAGCGNSMESMQKAAEEAKTPVEEKSEETVGSKQEEQEEADPTGTYVGMHGSGLILYQGGKADYYWKEWDEVEGNGKWKIDGERVVISIPGLGYDVYSEIGTDGSGLMLCADDDGWKDERFILISSDTKEKSVDEWIDAIEKELNITIERPGAEEDKIPVEVGGIRFMLPGYYTKRSDDEYVSKDGNGIVKLFSKEADGLSIAMLTKKKEIFAKLDENYKENLGGAMKDSLTKETVREDAVAGYISREYEAILQDDDNSGTVRCACVLNTDCNMIAAVMLISADLSQIDYVSDYETMLRTAEKAGGNTDDDDKGSNEEKSGSDQDKTSDAPAGVNPELKAFLDDYEAFCDEYAAFMKKYLNNPTDVLGMLGDYTRMVQNLEEYSKRLDEYDPDVMSPEDAAYYLEVVTRCQKKMLAFAE